MLTASALLLAALSQGQPQPQPQRVEQVPEVPTSATDPYRCWVSFDLDGLRASMWRDFQPGRPDDYYKIQAFQPDDRDIGGPFATWNIDNRPPARPRHYGWDVGRPEAEAFRNGPGHVNFGMIRYGRVADGAISARLYGDGAYAGTVLALRARDTRWTYRHGGDGTTFSVQPHRDPRIAAILGAATRWEAVLVDAAGRELARKTVQVPAPAPAQAAFERARADLLRHREAFLRRPTWNRDQICSSQIDELDSPI